jgi:hypothetical protein
MFNLPTIPTDSLYKFLFIGGLILVIAAFYFSNQRFNSMKSDSVHQKLDSLDYVCKQIGDDHNKKYNFIISVISALDSNNTSNAASFLPVLYFDYQDSLQHSPSFQKSFNLLNKFRTNDDTVITYLKNHIANIRVMMGNLKTYEDDIYMPEINTVTDKEKMYQERDHELLGNLKVFNIYINTAGSLGILFALFGAIMWYIKIQKPTDENQIIQIEQLKANLDIQHINAKLDTEMKQLQIEQLKNAKPS